MVLPLLEETEELLALRESLEDFQDRGRIRVHSESWVAQSDRPVRKGERVRVVAMDGLTLKVTEADDD